MIDPFHDVRDKRMSELSPEQRERAAELWLRTNCGPHGDVSVYWWGHLQTLFRIIDRLRHEAKADEMRDALIARLDAAERENERLRAENDALTADALRYRWLRGREDGRYMTVYAFRTDVDEVCLGEELDAAIDAAMAAEQSEK